MSDETIKITVTKADGYELSPRTVAALAELAEAAAEELNESSEVSGFNQLKLGTEFTTRVKGKAPLQFCLGGYTTRTPEGGSEVEICNFVFW